MQPNRQHRAIQGHEVQITTPGGKGHGLPVEEEYIRTMSVTASTAVSNAAVIIAAVIDQGRLVRPKLPRLITC